MGTIDDPSEFQALVETQFGPSTQTRASAATSVLAKRSTQSVSVSGSMRSTTIVSSDAITASTASSGTAEPATTTRREGGSGITRHLH